MTSPPAPRLDLLTTQGAPALSAPQEEFNRLIGRIQAQRALLAAWEAASQLLHQTWDRKLVPLLARLHEVQAEMALFLDEAAGRKGLARTDRDTLHAVIGELARGLMASEAGAPVKALYEKYADSDDDARAEASSPPAGEAANTMEFESHPDSDPHADPESPEAILRRVEAQMQAAQDHAATERERHHARRAKKASAQQRRQQEAAQQASQSVRAIYRKLASALHPDRASDAAERERKTALMQRVNQAYDANNLLDLLQLQLEVEQVDLAHMNNLGEARLRHYNQVLTDQLAQLQRQTSDVEAGYRQQFGLPPHTPLQPAALQVHLRTQLRHLEREIGELKLQRRAMEDSSYLKRWLKVQRRHPPPDAPD